MSDSVADFLTRIRNGVIADRDVVAIPSSRFNQQLARVLEDEGYIEGFKVERRRPIRRRGRNQVRSEFDMLDVTLKYTEDREPVITGLQRVSKPGRRQYVRADELPRVLGGMGTAIITTSAGVMSAYEARRRRLGGEVVAYVW
jgi:small subunit ribosomal protein S8